MAAKDEAETSELRNRITDALQEDVSDQGRVVVGWVMVMESIDHEGHRWLSRLDGLAGGNSMPSWQRDGYLHSALNGEWPTSKEDDD